MLCGGRGRGGRSSEVLIMQSSTQLASTASRKELPKHIKVCNGQKQVDTICLREKANVAKCRSS